MFVMVKVALVVALACFVVSSIECADDELKVTLSTGTLLGKWQKSANGKPYKQFLRVPYARPPKGTLRFKPPEPPLPWSGDRSAILEAPPCPQHEPFAVKNYIGREDCLYANVFVPGKKGTLSSAKHLGQLAPENGAHPLLADQTVSEAGFQVNCADLFPSASNIPKFFHFSPSDKRSKGLRPVFVFIHGGAFVTGTSASFWYNPVHIMDGDTIVVTFNYRLNVFGFLTMRNELAPGNLGFRDTIQVLKWIQQEIANFGGDPKRVTVAGHSAGGALASSLLYTKEATGLFSQVILFSGNALCPFVFRSKETEKASEDVIGMLGCDFDDPQKTLDCMQKVKTVALQKAAQAIAQDSLIPTHWTLRLDAELRSPLFQKRISRDTEIVNKVPVMLGITKDDGIIHPAAEKFSDGYLKKLNNTWTKECPVYLMFDFEEPTRVKMACESARREYFGPTGEMDETRGFDLAELMRDRLFGVCSVDLAEEARKSSPVYMYSFQYVPNNVSVVDFSDTFRQAQDRLSPRYKGSTHSTDMISLFRILVTDARASKFTTEANKILRSTFISRILNFVDYGNPNGPNGKSQPNIPEWPLYESTVKRHFVFDVFPRISQHILSERRIDFWRSFDNGLRKRILNSRR